MEARLGEHLNVLKEEGSTRGTAVGSCMRRERFGSGSAWEAKAGYSRAVRVGDRVLVAGTTGTWLISSEDAPEDDGLGSGDEGENGVYREARSAMRNVIRALEQAGASAEDVVRTRLYVTDVAFWQSVARAHREVFGGAAPASTLVEVSSLVEEEMRVEVEAEAVLGDEA